MGRLNGKVAIVTGAALGIGAYYARGLAAEGAWVAIADIEPADKVVAAIKEAGGEAMSAICDVSDGAAVAKFVHAVDEAYGGIDILVNNAALARMGRTPVEEMNSDEWDRYFAVNVRGMMEFVKVVVPIMRRRKYGKIINISSGTVWNGPPMMLQYVSTKGAILSMSRALSTSSARTASASTPSHPASPRPNTSRARTTTATISRRWRRPARCSARKCPRIWSARAFSWRRPIAISSPASASWSMAAR